METKSQEGSDQKQKKIHKVDKRLLDLFWTLAEGNDSKRVVAAESLCQLILENKAKDPDNAVSQQTYCLQRLVRGLSSSRKFARVGYAVALTKLLRQVKDVEVKVVLETVSEELKVSAHDPKSEVGSKLLGRVFAYGSLVQSDRKLKTEQLGTVVSELVSLGERKSYIRPMCTQALVDLISRVTPLELTSSVWPVLQSDLAKGWQECTPDRFLLLLASRRKNKTLVDKTFLQNHWAGSKVLGKKSYGHVLHLLRRSVDVPQLQPALVEAISQEVTRKADSEELVNFWTKVGNPMLTSTVPRKQVAMLLFNHMLEHAADLRVIHKMLFPAVATVICKTSEKKDEQLTDVCSKAESLLAGACGRETGGGSVLEVVKGFVHTCHRHKSYEFLRSTALSSIVSSLPMDCVEELTHLCMDGVMGRGDLFVQVAEEDSDKASNSKEKLIQQLVPLLRVVALSGAGQQGGLTGRILHSLFLHSFFTETQASTDTAQDTSQHMSAHLRSVCQATFYRTLMQLLSMKPERGGEEEHVVQYIAVLTDLALYAQKLLSSPDTVQPVKAISEEVREEWNTVMQIVTATKKKKSSKAGMGEMEAFTLLILHLAFDLFTEPESTVELLQDIYVCRDKAAKKHSSKHSAQGEPHWVEVITEILLSMLSRASKLARKTTVTVFKSLSAHLTPAALQLVTQVMKKDKFKKDEDIFEFEDMQTDANGEEEKDSSDDEDDEEEEMETDDDGESDDDDDDEEDEEKVDEELRHSIKLALGSAAAASDEEDEEEDLSDSEMFKLDEQLAAAFRSIKKPSKKEKKEKRREVGSFRLRALDLLEVVVKGDRCGDFVPVLVEPLLQLVTVKYKGGGGDRQASDTQQLCNRATELFHFLCKQRNLVDHLHSEEELLDTTRSLLQLAQSAANPHLAAEIANGCLCLMRLMTQLPNKEPSATKKKAKRVNGTSKESCSPCSGDSSFVHTIQMALEEYLVTRKNSKFNMAFFTAMIQKYPMVFWPLVSTVQTSLKSSETKVHTKTQACSLLVQLLRLNKRDSLTEEQWSSFFATVPPVLTKLVMSQHKGEVKAGLLLELLTALFHITHMTSVQERKEMLSTEVLTHLTQLKGTFNKDTRKMHNKLTQLLSQPANKKQKGKKRKHKELEEGTVHNGTSAA